MRRGDIVIDDIGFKVVIWDYYKDLHTLKEYCLGGKEYYPVQELVELFMDYYADLAEEPVYMTYIFGTWIHRIVPKSAIQHHKIPIILNLN